LLRSLKDLEHYTVTVADGDVGDARNFLIDDERWAIRYLILETSGLFDGHQVLISPVSFREVDWATRRFHLALTKAKVNNSPSVDTEKPVSRQHENDYFRYYGYAPYWGYSGLWGIGDYPGLLATELWHETAVEHSTESGDIHLRSAAELRGYHVQGLDEAVGHIEDFIVDDATWEVRYLVIDTSDWWFGKKVLVAPRWTKRISWEDRTVYVDLSRDAVKKSPQWDASETINREYETRLYDYYGRPQYWDKDDRALGAPAPHHSMNHPS
jgi:hypothetical protein